MYPHPKNKTKVLPAIIFLLMVIFSFGLIKQTLATDNDSSTSTPQATVAGVEDAKLNEALQQKKDRIAELEAQINEYQKNINYQKKQSVSLSNQISILTNEVDKLAKEIDLKTNQIEATEMEISTTEEKITNTENDIGTQKSHLTEFIKTMDRLDQKNAFEILLSVDNFSDYYNHLHTLSILENNTGDILKELKDFKANLEANKKLLGEKKASLENLLQELDEKKSAQEERSYAKQSLLKESRNSEAKFSSLVSQLKAEQNSVNTDIVELEKKMRQQISKDKNKLESLGDSNFIWPTKSHQINTYFHDPDYPFRYVYEHPAVDLKSPQGASIVAASSGYVAKAKDAGMGYSYIMIIHADGLSTVYGHISRILVAQDQFVSAGEIIGLSGGMPGTPGAGRMTTGPHLHFEVRKNGIPVNPLDFLP
ncbi:MAG TPA: peptidoglycan DD-metalloendopeptidase family protein [bacterium]|nr:peptidoglycan DD-metalloendopeptidase family protein [bacterium]